MAEVTTRQVTADDADAIAGLWQQLVDYHRQLDPDLPGAAHGGAKRYARRLVQRLDDPYTRAFVAEADGQVVGFVLGMIVDLMADIFDQEPGGFLADIYVHPDYRRQGIGHALVTALTDWFRHQQVYYFEWQVAARNQEGRAFWRSFGGREVMVRMRADLRDSAW